MKKKILRSVISLVTSLTVACTATGFGTIAAESPMNDDITEVTKELDASVFSITPTYIELNLNPNSGSKTFEIKVNGPTSYSYQLNTNSAFDSSYSFSDTGLTGFPITAKKTGTYTLSVSAKSGNTTVETQSCTVKVSCTHVFGPEKIIEQPTCKTKGRSEKTCQYCGTASYTSLKASHNFVDEVTKQPTCTSAGTANRVCATCGYKESGSSIPALGHSFATDKTVAATCTSEGYTQYKCTRCNATEKRNTVSALGHNWQQTGSTAATCTAAGSKSFKCSRCNQTKTETNGTKLGHSFTIKSKTVAATCTAQGYTTYKCSRCSATENRDYVNATGHSYKGVQTKAPTTTSEGVMTYTCTKCGNSYTQSIPKLTVTAKKGDVDGNNSVNLDDLALLQQYLAGWNVKINTTNANVDGDKDVDMDDLALLQQYLAGWNVTLK